MTTASTGARSGLPSPAGPIAHSDRVYIDGAWAAPSTTRTWNVIDSGTEDVYYAVAEAQDADIDHAVRAARAAFDDGPWPRMSHAVRAGYLRAIAAGLRARAEIIGQISPRQCGVLHSFALIDVEAEARQFEFYAGLADSYPFEEEHAPTAGGEFGLLVREPVGVVAAIVPWNGPLGSMTVKVAPALLAGCTVIVKASPEAPGEPYLLAEIADEIGLPKGVLNVVAATREVSEHLVRNPGVDKVALTGSTAVGRRVASILSERIGRYTLELGGKSAAVVLEDADLTQTAAALAGAECLLTGQVCSSLTRVIVPRSSHDQLVEALANRFAQVRVGSPFDPHVDMGPLAMRRQRDRVEAMIERGVQDGARLVTGGKRPPHLDRGFYIEPTLFAGVDNASAIAQEEIFGPVLSVIPAESEADAVRIANDTIYGLNASVFTPDVDRARAVAARLRSGTVGHNAFRTDLGIAFGGFKQSGTGREGGREGLSAYLETKTIILEGRPSGYVA